MKRSTWNNGAIYGDGVEYVSRGTLPLEEGIGFGAGEASALGVIGAADAQGDDIILGGVVFLEEGIVDEEAMQVGGEVADFPVCPQRKKILPLDFAPDVFVVEGFAVGCVELQMLANVVLQEGGGIGGFAFCAYFYKSLLFDT